MAGIASGRVPSTQFGRRRLVLVQEFLAGLRTGSSRTRSTTPRNPRPHRKRADRWFPERRSSSSVTGIYMKSGNPAPFRDAHTIAQHGWPLLPVYSVRNGHCACSAPDCAHPGSIPVRGTARRARAPTSASSLHGIGAGPIPTLPSRPAAPMARSSLMSIRATAATARSPCSSSITARFRPRPCGHRRRWMGISISRAIPKLDAHPVCCAAVASMCAVAADRQWRRPPYTFPVSLMAGCLVGDLMRSRWRRCRRGSAP